MMQTLELEGVLLSLTAQAWQAGPEGEPLACALAEELLSPWTPACQGREAPPAP